MSSPTEPHIPVLRDEVIDALAIVPGERHIDCTFGAGGYTDAILERGAEVAALDSPPRARGGGPPPRGEGIPPHFWGGGRWGPLSLATGGVSRAARPSWRRRAGG